MSGAPARFRSVYPRIKSPLLFRVSYRGGVEASTYAKLRNEGIGQDMPEMLTFAQAAAALGVHIDDVRRWVRTEQCPVVMVGRARRVPAAWVAGELASSGHAELAG